MADTNLAIPSSTLRTENHSICASCRELLVRPGELPISTAISKSQVMISQAAENGCLICHFIYNRTGFAGLPPDSVLEMRLVFVIEKNSTATEAPCPSDIYFTVGREGYAMQLARAEFDGNTAYMRSLDPKHHAYSAVPVVPASLTDSIGEAGRLKRAAGWMHDCSENHKHCSSTFAFSDRNIYPGLISVETSTARVVAVDAAQGSRFPQYMTLSHKWRLPFMPMLLRSNIQRFERVLDVHQLPQTFQDALSFARALSIRFAWIDTLCIVQDDCTDKEQEISKMGSIYRNALLNIGGLAAAEDQPVVEEFSGIRKIIEREGCLQRMAIALTADISNSDIGLEPVGSDILAGLYVRQEDRASFPVLITVKRSGLKWTCFAWREHIERYELQDSALMRRGWVLQERLLSRRSIYFGSQMVWECSELLACEKFPSGVPSWISLVPSARHGIYYPYRLSTILARNNVSQEWKGQDESQNSDRYLNWLILVVWYTRCRLLFEEDLFPALSGLALAFQVYLKDEYHAGLWKGHMIQGLLWVKRANAVLKDSNVYPTVYRAPSWSWASVTYPVIFMGDPGNACYHNGIAIIEHVHTQTLAGDPFGRVLGRNLRLTAHLRLCSRFIWNPRFDYVYDNTKNTKERYLLLLSYTVVSRSSEIVLQDGYLYGLVLELVDPATSTYRRIGCFKHLWGLKRPYPDHLHPEEEFPEFLGFDLNNREQ